MNPEEVARALERLQTESAKWVERNFAPRPASHPMLGVVEELGELAEAQAATPGEEGYLDRVKDACADAVIFMVDLCNATGIKFREVYDSSTPFLPGEFFDYFAELGRCCHAVLKMEQGIRGSREEHVKNLTANLRLVLQGVREVAAFHEFDLLEQVLATWGEVSRRNWRCRRQDCRLPLPDPDDEFCAPCGDEAWARVSQGDV